MGTPSSYRTITGYVTKGYARKLTNQEAVKTSSRTWYLLHHGVISPHKPGKIRVVFDASASYRGHSLNEALLPGPTALFSNLFGILQRFRLFDVALVGDIEAMFQQVRVAPEDSDSLRFLYKANLHDTGPPDTYQMVSHVFGATDSPACAVYALKKTAKDNARDFGNVAVDALLKDVYMDDLIKSVEGTQDAAGVVQEVRSLVARGGFRMHKWMSNKLEILADIAKSELSDSVHNMDFDETEIQIQRTLGMKWDLKHDTFIFCCEPKSNTLTKRGVVSTMSSIFDPCGFIAPFTVRAKMLVQQLWSTGLGWDENLPEDMLSLWQAWLSELQQLKAFELPRHHPNFTSQVKDIELHVFSDAPEAAFAAVGYLRYVTAGNTVIISFLASKCRVAPLKVLTVPRIELQGALLAARLGRLLEELLKGHRQFPKLTSYHQ